MHSTAAGISLIVGADAQIGRALCETLAADGVTAIGTSRRVPLAPGRVLLDLAAGPQTWVLPESISAAYLCAGVTLLDECRRDPLGTRQVNVAGTVELAGRLVAAGAFVVFPSSNLVYDGSKSFRSTGDPPCPSTEYGRQKAEAERQLLALGERVAVVRLSKILSPKTPLLTQWRAALEQGRAIQPFSDMVAAPLPMPFVAQSLIRIADLRRPGIFQLSGDRDISYAQIARYLATRLGRNSELIQPVEVGRTSSLVEALPAHTTLDMTRAQRELGLAPPSVWQAIDFAAGLREHTERSP